MAEWGDVLEADRSDAFVARCLDYLDGRLSASEADDLRRQLNDDPAKRQAFVLLCYQVQLVAHASGRAMPAVDGPRRRSGEPIVWRNYRLPGAMVAAALLLLAGAIVAVYMLKGVDDEPAPTPTPSVATVSYAADVEWADGVDPMYAGDGVPPRTIRTTAGRLELILSSGAMVHLAGAVDVRIEGPMAVAVSRGHGRFVCPPGAEGFTVRTPHGVRIVDLGTEFEVDVDEAGDAMVRVLDGAVQVGSAQLPDTRLVEGYEVRFIEGASGPIVTFDPDTLLHERFDTARSLGTGNDGEILGGDLAVGADEPTGAGGHLRVTAEQTLWFNVVGAAEPALDAAGLLDANGDIGRPGSTVYLSWVTQGEATDPQGFGGVSLYAGDRESLFVGKARDRGEYSTDYEATDKKPLDGNPSTKKADRIALDTVVHRYVVRIDYSSEGDRARVWIDPDAGAEPDEAAADYDGLALAFDRLRLAAGRGKSRFPEDAPIGAWRFDGLRVGTTWRSVLPLDSTSDRDSRDDSDEKRGVLKGTNG